MVLLIQAMLVFLIKQNWSKEDFKQLNFLEKVIHVVENCFIPYNVLEWENIKTGNSEIHQKKMKSNLVEVLLVMVVNFIVNFILLIPMFILGTATSIYRLHFLSTSRVLLYRDTIDRVLFYIEMTVMMSDYPHKVLKLVCQAMVEIFANFVA